MKTLLTTIILSLSLSSHARDLLVDIPAEDLIIKFEYGIHDHSLTISQDLGISYSFIKSGFWASYGEQAIADQVTRLYRQALLANCQYLTVSISLPEGEELEHANPASIAVKPGSSCN